MSLLQEVTNRLEQVQEELSDTNDLLRCEFEDPDDRVQLDEQSMILEGRVKELLWIQKQLKQE